VSDVLTVWLAIIALIFVAGVQIGVRWAASDDLDRHTNEALRLFDDERRDRP
jgi:hypothetical protein